VPATTVIGCLGFSFAHHNISGCTKAATPLWRSFHAQKSRELVIPAPGKLFVKLLFY
jgi:hypothetical protein